MEQEPRPIGDTDEREDARIYTSLTGKKKKSEVKVCVEGVCVANACYTLLCHDRCNDVKRLSL